MDLQRPRVAATGSSLGISWLIWGPELPLGNSCQQEMISEIEFSRNFTTQFTCQSVLPSICPSFPPSHLAVVRYHSWSKRFGGPCGVLWVTKGQRSLSSLAWISPSGLFTGEAAQSDSPTALSGPKGHVCEAPRRGSSPFSPAPTPRPASPGPQRLAQCPYTPRLDRLIPGQACWWTWHLVP